MNVTLISTTTLDRNEFIIISGNGKTVVKDKDGTLMFEAPMVNKIYCIKTLDYTESLQIAQHAVTEHDAPDVLTNVVNVYWSSKWPTLH